METEVWKPVIYTCRTMTEVEKGYRKVEGESLGLLHGILENKMYLYGTRFTVIVDHKPLIDIFLGHWKSLPMRVARHKSKVSCFDFNVVYEIGTNNPADYGSRHPVSNCGDTVWERRDRGILDGSLDEEILIHRCEDLLDAVTVPVTA